MDLKLKRGHGHPGAAAATTRCALHGSNVAGAGETGTAASGGGADQGGRGDGVIVIQNPSHKPLPKIRVKLGFKNSPRFLRQNLPLFSAPKMRPKSRRVEQSCGTSDSISRFYRVQQVQTLADLLVHSIRFLDRG